MMEKIVLDVSAEDLDWGTPGICNACPIALSLKRQFGNKCRPKVTPNRIFFTKDDKRYAAFVLPPEVVMFIYKYDNNYQGMTPEVFEVYADFYSSVSE